MTTDIYSLSFKNCCKVYPLRLIRPNNKYKYDDQNQHLLVINDIERNNCKITDVVTDNPKRSNIRCALCFSSTYACEYCEARAVLVQDAVVTSLETEIKKKFELRRINLENTIEFLKESPGSVKSKERDGQKIEELKEILENLKVEEVKELKSVSKRRQLAWPFSTMNALLRTNDLIRYTVRKIARNENLDKHEKNGFKGVSHFLSIPNFNFIDSISAEYMHSVCLGVGKRLIELTFDVGEARSKTSKRKLSKPNTFNELIKKIQSLREFNRRCRNLDVGIIKAQEYRNYILFFFIIIIKCIDDDFPKEKMIWLYLAFVIRACVIPNNEFDFIDVNDIKRACTKLYSLFEKCFGEKNCSYSIHVVVSHVLKIRGAKPLTARSAFRYESFYSEMKNLFEPGTTAPLKQILKNTMMKRKLEHHCCAKPIKYDCVKVPNTGLENNSMVYIFNEQNKYEFYNIIQINEDKTYQCTEQGRFEYVNDLTPEIDWSSVGFFRGGPSGREIKTFQKSQFHGKVIKVENTLITCPINVLQEQ